MEQPSSSPESGAWGDAPASTKWTDGRVTTDVDHGFVTTTGRSHSMDAPTPPLHTEPGTLCLSLEIDELPGDRLAALLDAIDQVVNEDVTLVSYRARPVRMELGGSWAALDRVRSAIEHEALRSVFGTHRPATQLERGEPRRQPPGRRLVLLADSDPARMRSHVEQLAREGIDACTVSRASAALRLMRRTALPFEALVMHHRLPDLEGTELLERLDPEHRRCSVLVFDDRVSAELARRYRHLGAYRYVPSPDGALQVIARVRSAIYETLAWRVAESPTPTHPEAPPRLLIDPDQAADRLRYLCGMSSLEREVAWMVLLGHRDLDIAKRLGKSERTAKRHVGRVLEKAGIENRASLWKVLFQDGFGEGKFAGDETRALAASAAHVPSSAPAERTASMQVGW